MNLFAGRGIALYEKVMAPGHGQADYILYVDKRVVGVIEAKKEGTPLSGVEWQSALHAAGLPADDLIRAEQVEGKPPFVFEANGVETHFTNGHDPDPRARPIFAFPKAETLAGDDSLEDLDSLPEPSVIAREIIENLLGCAGRVRGRRGGARQSKPGRVRAGRFGACRHRDQCGAPVRLVMS